MDLNHDKQIQSLLCYHYTIRHCECGKDSRFGRGVKAFGKCAMRLGCRWAGEKVGR